MSVPEGKRHSGRMEVHLKAQALASYTAKILANEKTFDPKVDPEIIHRIKSAAYDIYALLWTANRIHAETGPINRELRFRKQEEAYLLCDEMLAYIGVAKQVFHLRSKRMKYWAGLIVEVQRLIQGWKESDVKRYGKTVATDIWV